MSCLHGIGRVSDRDVEWDQQTAMVGHRSLLFFEGKVRVPSKSTRLAQVHHQHSRPGPTVQALRSSFALLIFLLAAVGCGRTDIDATYGKRRGSPGAESVNGTAVLAAMFESAGHRVTSWRRLSPKLEESDTIVWFPDSYSLPQPAERQFLENWLSRKPGRTLIYVGRDYDASINYWRRIRPLAPPTQAVELARRAAVAQAVHDKRRSKLPSKESCDWFVVEGDLPHRTAKSLGGPWADGIDANKVEIELDSRFSLPTSAEFEQWNQREWRFSSGQPTAERLLFADADPLVSRLSISNWNGSQVLVVTNGSFLLNMPLVNHEHRKLAGRLINACGPPGRVVFLESDDDGLAIFDKEPGANAPTGFEVFTVWPIGVILIHLTALGMLACFTLFPVFGRPRELQPAATADFGQHVAALGELLQLTGDREYAASRLSQYREQVKHEAKTKRRPRR